MPSRMYVKELPNGMTLLGEPMPHVESAAMTLLVAGGAGHDPPDAAGTAAVANEWCFRGAGDRDSRSLNDALDRLGCQHSENLLSENTQFSAALLGRNLMDLLPIYADIIRRPQLLDTTFEPCRDLVVQGLASLEDEPSQKVFVMLREKFYPWPLGRCVYGRSDTLAALTANDVRRHYFQTLSPGGAILAVAGAVQWEHLCQGAEECFGDWQGAHPGGPKLTDGEGGVTFVQKDTAQVQIAMAHRSVTMDHGLYYAARIAENVLSGGMSSRLFTEVRDKRGLVYSISSRYNNLRKHAGVFTAAGTTPDAAQQTLEVTVDVLRSPAGGIGEDELARARTQLKSSMMMQADSTVRRAGALAGDWYNLHRLRETEELARCIDRVTAADVMEYLRECPARHFTALVMGPRPIDTGALTKD